MATLRAGTRAPRPRGLSAVVPSATLSDMKMLSVLLLLISAAPARADEAAKSAKIEEMLKLTHVDQLMDQIMAQMQPMMDEQMKKMEEQMKGNGKDVPPEAKEMSQEFAKRMTAWFQSKLSWDKMKPIYVKIYSETLTEEELDGAIAYYRTAAGQSMIKKLPVLMQKSMSVVGDLLGDMAPELAKIGEEVEKKYKKK
jgi:uncharacterized protein